MISGLAAPGAVEVELTAGSSELERRPDPTVAVDALAGGKGRDKSSMAWTSSPDGAKS
jgi:hypothetical protein